MVEYQPSADNDANRDKGAHFLVLFINLIAQHVPHHVSDDPYR